MEQSRKRLTIGLLVSGIMDEFTKYICRGVMHEAKKADVNLVILPCKYLDRDLTKNMELMYEYQYNTLLSYVTKENIDAILVSADSIGCYTDRERMQRALEQYIDIPCVLIASKYEGYVSVMYDNDAGIREAVEYLIHELKCKRFCMIGGPDDNTDSYERKKVFVEVLKEHDIPFTERNYINGNLSGNNTEVFAKVLDNNPDAEAIFCVNDDVALGMYDEMKRRGIMPGKDMYIFGYDNTILASKSKPTLSSVWADAESLGAHSMQLLLRMLSGEKVNSQKLPTKFIKRDSFGVREKNLENMELVFDEQAIEEHFDEIFYRFTDEEKNRNIASIHIAFRDIMQGIFMLINGDGADAKLYTNIITRLDEFLDYGALEYADVAKLIKYIELVNEKIKRDDKISNDVKRVSEFTKVYCKIISAMDYRLKTIHEASKNETYSMKLFIGNIMQFEKGNDKSYMTLLQNLDWLDIKNACIYTFKEPIIHLYREEFALPKYMYLKTIRSDGYVVSVPVGSQKVNQADIYQQGRMTSDRTSMVLLPLFSNEMLYGALLCDMTDKLFENGEFIVNHMSSAVKMIHLLKANEKIQQQLEDNLVTLREKNIVLDTLSKSDGLTGILNRRGFEEHAIRYVSDRKGWGKKVLVSYVDMNNLKIINDRYGHEEGDFAIKLIGDKLEGYTQKHNGICGRIGGDEFACIIECNDKSDMIKFRDCLYEDFKNFNLQSDKLYNITVSVGTVVLDCDKNIELKEALALADEKLYEEKQHRVKSVDKVISSV